LFQGENVAETEELYWFAEVN